MGIISLLNGGCFKDFLHFKKSQAGSLNGISYFSSTNQIYYLIVQMYQKHTRDPSRVEIKKYLGISRELPKVQEIRKSFSLGNPQL